MLQLMFFEVGFCNGPPSLSHAPWLMRCGIRVLKAIRKHILMRAMAGSSLLDSVKSIPMSSANLKVYNFVSLAIWWLHVVSGCSLRSTYILQDPVEGLFLRGQQVLAESMPDFPGWVVTCISRISQLDHWKKKSVHNGCLSLFELIKRASDIDSQLRRGISTLCTEVRDRNSALSSSGSRCHDLQMSHVTGIFANSAFIYLNVVVSGSQGNIPVISKSIQETASE